MNNTQFIILLAIVVIAIIATAFTVNSCIEVPQTDNTELKELVKQHLRQSDSLQKVALDSMLAISQRDSAHNVAIHNIFNNSTKSKNEIIKTKPDNKRIVSILSWADSIARANQQPNTGW